MFFSPVHRTFPTHFRQRAMLTCVFLPPACITYTERNAVLSSSIDIYVNSRSDNFNFFRERIIKITTVFWTQSCFSAGSSVSGVKSLQFCRLPCSSHILSGCLTLIGGTQERGFSCKVQRRPPADIFLNESLPRKPPCRHHVHGCHGHGSAVKNRWRFSVLWKIRNFDPHFKNLYLARKWA
jgi:hypothetical protein